MSGIVNFGISTSAFREGFYEQRPRLERAALPALTYGWADLDLALPHVRVEPGYFRVYLEGEIPFGEFTRRVVRVGLSRFEIDRAHLCSLIRRRASVVLNRFETSCLITQDLCNQISRFTECPTMANAYFSVGGAPTFGQHWDRHDVFVVQLIGRKRWRIYEPLIELPVASQSSSAHKDKIPSSPLFDEVLNAGDILYVPRGWWHSADSLENQETHHIAVGLHPPLMEDYARWAADEVSQYRVEPRRSLSLVTGSNSREARKLAALADAVGQHIANSDNAMRFKRDVASRQSLYVPLSLKGVLESPASTVVRGNWVALNTLRPFGPDERSVVVNDCSLDLDTESADLLSHISETGGIFINDLKRRFNAESAANIDSLLHSLEEQGVLQILERPVPACDFSSQDFRR